MHLKKYFIVKYEYVFFHMFVHILRANVIVKLQTINLS